MRKHSTIHRLALISVFAALYVILCLLDINIGRIKFTLAATVVYFAAFCLPTGDCFLLVLLGVFVDQLIYGLSPTTLIWMFPPFIRPLLISPLRALFARNGEVLDEKKMLSVFLVLISSLLTTFSNTGALILDSLIIGYPYQAILYDVLIQALITMVTGGVEIVLLFPLFRALRKAGFIEDGNQLRKKMFERTLKESEKAK